jgi:outer membrane protein OmpA-like peptidoglycan-associated protein
MRKHSGLIAFVALTGAAVLSAAGPAAAQTYKAEDIVKHFGPAAAPKPGVTRGLCVGTEAECARAGHAVEIVKPPSAFDLVVKFKYDSDVLEPEAKRNLDEFAKALKDNRLSTFSFVVEGHTDAVGSDVDNLSLSDRRAESAATLLTQQFGVPAENLTSQGYGEQYLKVPTDGPERRNRRVTVRNITPLLNGGEANAAPR